MEQQQLSCDKEEQLYAEDDQTPWVSTSFIPALKTLHTSEKSYLTKHHSQVFLKRS
jgi:hypothetical protein